MSRFKLGFFNRPKVDLNHFVTFTCDAERGGCNQRQTHAVKRAKKFCDCFQCGLPHRIESTEVSETLNQK